MELDALIQALAPSEVTGGRQVSIDDLAYDTRSVSRGALFFCVPGARTDGHDLAWEAIERGAEALVVERPLDVDVPQLLVPSTREAMAVAADVFFGEPTKELELAGVTGTNGKTTTAFLLRGILDAAGRRPGLVGTVEWEVGGERRPAPFTTPEAIDLQRLFRKMLDAGRPQRGRRGELARRCAPAARPRSLRRARLHEPDARITSTCTARWRSTSMRSAGSSRVRSHRRRR